jgi:hypothetical protein
MVGPTTSLLPIEIAQGVVDSIDLEPKVTGEVEAQRFTDSLMVHYVSDRQATLFEAKQLTAQMAALNLVFQSYSPSLGKRVVGPVKGLPSRLKFRPKPADLVEALDAEKKRRDLVRANALSHMKEREDRRLLAENEATYAKNKMSPEERAAQVQALLRLRSIPPPSELQTSPELAGQDQAAPLPQ